MYFPINFRNSLAALLTSLVIAFLCTQVDAQDSLKVSTSTTKTTTVIPLKVYILVGQSNMQGHAHVRTIERMKLDPKMEPILKDLLDKDGNPKVSDDVWISSIGSSEEEQIGKLTAGFGAGQRGPKIGPEWTFGVYMQQLVKEPILIIKTSWGGKSINTDFRPPSAGPYQFNEQQIENFKKQDKDIEQIKKDRAKATGHYYKLMIDHVKKVTADIKRVYPEYDADQGYELAGIVWFQGWNDMVDRSTYPNRDQAGGYDQYSKVLTHFIRDVRKDLSAPKLPFVIGVMGAGGPVDLYPQERKRYAGVHQNFRDAMAAPAALPEFKGNVKAVLTEKFWDVELDQLRLKESKIKREVQELKKANNLSRQEEQAEMEKRLAKNLSPVELKILKTGASNAEFHYLGSAQVMTQIGKGFAEALFELSK